MAMQADRRLWRTADGRLVEDGDGDAAFLAYRPGDRISAADEAKVPGAQDAEESKPKSRASRPADKSRSRGEDK